MEFLTLPIYTEKDKELALFMEWIYRDVNRRPSQLKFNDKVYNYNQEKSTDLWGLYERDNEVILGIHGADDLELNLTAIKQFITPELEDKIVENFCDFLDMLENSGKEIFLVAHSLGCWIISLCETLRGHSDNKGVMFAPYVPVSESVETAKFLIENGRYRKIYYVNDPVGQNLKNAKNKSNVLELKPKSDPRLYVKSHYLSTFNRLIHLLNYDKDNYYKPLISIEDKPVGEEIQLKIMNYNVQMLDKSVRDLKQLKRAGLIPKEIGKRYGNIDIIIMEEVFDEDAEKIIDRGMARIGFIYKSKKVGSPPDYRDKFDDGGVKIYSKHKISHSDYTIFSKSEKEDKIASKGIVRASIDIEGLPIDVYGTHLQGGGSEKTYNKQVEEIDSFISRKRLSFLSGDFNTNRYSQYNRFDILLNKDMREFNYPDGQPSTIGTDFSVKIGEQKWLDNIFYFENPKYNVSGNIEIGSIRYNRGFERPKDISRTTGEIIKGVGTKIIKEGTAGEIITSQIEKGVEKGIKETGKKIKKTGKKVKKTLKSIF